MLTFYKELFHYSFISNQKIIDRFHHDAILENSNAHRLLAHLLAAHHIWNNRILEKTPQFEVWPIISVINCAAINHDNVETSLKILEEVDITQMISYQNSKGQEFRNSVQDILFHVINHSTYHRGQIAKEFRNMGVEPENTDYIFYKR